MPVTKYEIRKNGDQFCIYGKGESSPIHGGKGSCHANRADAVKQLRGIYANSKSFSEKLSLVPTKNFTDVFADENPAWIQVFPFGFWPHPVYTDTHISRETAADFVKNFKENVRRQEINLDYEHGADKAKGAKASGWYKDLEVRDDGVYGLVEFTPTALSEIKAGEWKYFSPEFVDAWEDVETGEIHHNVLVGGTLTNKPWMKDMVPINFSEVVLEESTTKYQYKGDKWIVSEDDGQSWRNATVDEVRELEHSEPGTGDPPQPRLDEDDRSGDKDGSGSRRDSPPPAYEDKKEGSDMKLGAAALKLLGLPEDADEAAVNTAIESAFEKLPELKEFHEKNQKRKKFSEEYPEEAAKMEILEQKTIADDAKRFSERFSRITKAEGEGDARKVSRTSRGLSGLALQKVEEMHKSFSEGTANAKMFGELMEVLTDDKAILEYGERGSSRDDSSFTDEAEGDARKRLADAAVAIQNKELSEGKQLSFGDALARVQVENPKLFTEAMGVEAPKAE